MGVMLLDEREETVLGVQIENAIRDGACLMAVLQRAHREAEKSGKPGLAGDLYQLLLTQRAIQRELEDMK